MSVAAPLVLRPGDGARLQALTRSSTARDGSGAKTLATAVGDVALAVPRNRAGSFEPRLVPKGSRQAGDVDG